MADIIVWTVFILVVVVLPSTLVWMFLKVRELRRLRVSKRRRENHQNTDKENYTEPKCSKEKEICLTCGGRLFSFVNGRQVDTYCPVCTRGGL